MNPASVAPASPSRRLGELARLAFQLTRREVVGRYRGSLLGLGWSFFNPLLMLAVYTWIFSGVFKARWSGETGESQIYFALNLFVGMTVHGLLAECVNRAPNVMLANVNFIKKVVFPLEVLPVVALGSALFHTLISLSMLMIAAVLALGGLPATALYTPLILAPLVLLTVGAAWTLASLGVFIRDIAQVTGVFTTLLLFLSPVFYPVAAAPEGLRAWLMFNPLTYVIEWTRGALLLGVAPPLDQLALGCVLGAAAAAFGYWWFQKTRKGFADVL